MAKISVLSVVRVYSSLRSFLRTAFKQGYIIAMVEEAAFVEARFVQSQFKEHKKLFETSVKSAKSVVKLVSIRVNSWFNFVPFVSFVVEYETSEKVKNTKQSQS